MNNKEIVEDLLKNLSRKTILVQRLPKLRHAPAYKTSIRKVGNKGMPITLSSLELLSPIISAVCIGAGLKIQGKEDIERMKKEGISIESLKLTKEVKKQIEEFYTKELVVLRLAARCIKWFEGQ